MKTSLQIGPSKTKAWAQTTKKPTDMAAPHSQAEKIKAHGNECFAKGKLDAAIEAYSECICLEPGIAVYYTNRALCYHKKGQWDAVVRDCQVVLSIDAQSVKAHYMLGQALIEQGQLQQGEPAGPRHGGQPALRRVCDAGQPQKVEQREELADGVLDRRARDSPPPLRLEREDGARRQASVRLDGVRFVQDHAPRS